MIKLKASQVCISRKISAVLYVIKCTPDFYLFMAKERYIQWIHASEHVVFFIKVSEICNECYYNKGNGLRAIQKFPT